MLFNSLHFLVFLPVVCAVYFLSPRRWRTLILLAASCYFYMSWNPKYVLLMFGSASVDYAAARAIEATADGRRRRLLLALSLSTNLAILFFFKYYGFFIDSLRVVLPARTALLPLEFLLPVGISFYTFQSMAYTIDVYRGQLPAEPNWFKFALYVAFFPQLVAGPIERAGRLMPQLRHLAGFDDRRAVDGLQLALWGMFKKVVIADRLAIVVDQVYRSPDVYHGATMWLATYFFAFQIYADFSAYSDIAVGVARIFGVDLMANFAQPYFSRSISEFWRRWHISLSTWFRDYLYHPLGGNRVGDWRWRQNIAVVFVVSGLWHGAAWTFVWWGALHAAYILIGTVTAPVRARCRQLVGLDAHPRVLALWQVAVTFHLVLAAWVMFRAQSIQHARTIFAALADPAGAVIQGLNRPQLVLAVAALAVLLAVDLASRFTDVGAMLRRQPQWLRWSVYATAVASVLAFGEFRSTQFIYFQF
jgi:D-alanyl-lipoteichoic acid acyltransferase DltB (MBOAT superfamily)